MIDIYRCNDKIIAIDTDTENLYVFKKILSIDANFGEDKVSDIAVPVVPKTKERKCGLCGKAGHQKRTCPSVDTPVEESVNEDEDNDKALTKSQYESIKESVVHDMASKDIAEMMGLPLSEVNKVLIATSFMGYIKTQKND